MMAGIRAKDTKPELLVRRGLHALGFRFRLHQRNLPGKPDLVLAKYHVAIFVHGCFWHCHDCKLFRWPSSHKAFWRRKLSMNRDSDERARSQLLRDGWRVLTIWECAIKGGHRHSEREIIRRSAKWIRSSQRNYEIRGS